MNPLPTVTMLLIAAHARSTGARGQFDAQTPSQITAKASLMKRTA